VFVGASLLGGDREGAYLTYATLLKLAPDRSKSEPDIDPLLIPLRDATRASYPDYPAELVGLDKEVVQLIKTYAAQQKKRKKPADKRRIVKHLCVEAIAASPVEAMWLPWTKFRLAIDARCSYAFDAESLWRRQEVAATRKPWMTSVLSKGLTGKKRSADEMRAWVRSHYDPNRIAWFERYQEAWNDALIYFRLSDKPLTRERWVHDFYGGVPNRKYILPGIPCIYIIAFAGMLVAVWRPARFGWLHAAWVVTMLGGLYVVSLVGVTNARFRFVYEPFVLLYFFLLFDCIADWLQSRVANRRAEAGECSS
jgi:hypothetical protein